MLQRTERLDILARSDSTRSDNYPGIASLMPGLLPNIDLRYQFALLEGQRREMDHR
jgi:hypothetical protein